MSTRYYHLHDFVPVDSYAVATKAMQCIMGIDQAGKAECEPHQGIYLTQQCRGILLSLLLQCWDYKHLLASSLLVALMIQTRTLMFAMASTLLTEPAPSSLVCATMCVYTVYVCMFKWCVYLYVQMHV